VDLDRGTHLSIGDAFFLSRACTLVHGLVLCPDGEKERLAGVQRVVSLSLGGGT